MLRERALLTGGLSFAISDPQRDDDPLVWVNPAFQRLTGYEPTEAVGRNCRFLQGPDTDPQAVSRVSVALAAGRSITEVLLNYRKDGTPFWNQVSISPVHDDAGKLVNFVGVQSDVTDRMLVEHEHRMALVTAEEARNDQRLLTEATTWMTEALNVPDAAERLSRAVVPALADYCCVDLITEPATGMANRLAAHHRDPAKVEALYQLAGQLDMRVGGSDPVSQVLTTGQPRLLAEMPARPTIRVRDEQETLRLYQELRPRSAVLVPLLARNRVLGVLTLCSEEPCGRRYRQRDLYLVTDLAGKAALAIDNARLYAREHDAAETLQLSLLPTVGDVPGLSAAARYLVGADDVQVGGDWYDLFALPDGAVGLAVGDVVGHDLAAAAAMGQLRAVLRSFAWEGLRPGAVLERCDQLVQSLEMASMATALYARLELAAPDGVRCLAYSNAGHPPPVLREPDGSTRFLPDGFAPLLGAVGGVVRSAAQVHCRPGSQLLFYTDGLIDLPGHNADVRQQRLREIVRAAPAGIPVEQLCDRVLAELAPTGAVHDDIALLAVLVEDT